MRFLFSDYFLIGLLALICGFSIYILPGTWYINNQWVDIPLHFFGGLWVGLIFLALFGRFPELNSYARFLESRLLVFIFTLAMAALVGVGWEFYEFIFDNMGSLADTIADLALDLFGATMAALAGVFVFKK